MSEKCGKKLKKSHNLSFNYKIEASKSFENLSEILKSVKEWTDYNVEAKVYCPFACMNDTRFYKFERSFHHVPPVRLEEKKFCNFTLFFYSDDSSDPLTVLLGTKGDSANFEKILLSSGSCLYVTEFSPYNWFCLAPTPDESLKAVKLDIIPVNIPFTTEFFEPISFDLESAKAEFIDSSLLVLDNFFPEAKAREMTSLLDEFSFKGNILATLHWFEETNEAIDHWQSSLSSFPWFSREFTSLLEDLTNLSLDIPIDSPKWKKFKPGHYVILNDRYPEPEGLDLIFTLSPSDQIVGGDWVYLSETGEEIARFPPQSNSLVLVYRAPESGVKRFKQYWNKFGSSSATYTYQMIITFQTKSS
jgi:hypothetical protein